LSWVQFQGQEIVETAHGMAVCQALEHLFEVGERLDMRKGISPGSPVPWRSVARAPAPGGSYHRCGSRIWDGGCAAVTLIQTTSLRSSRTMTKAWSRSKPMVETRALDNTCPKRMVSVTMRAALFDAVLRGDYHRLMRCPCGELTHRPVLAGAKIKTLLQGREIARGPTKERSCRALGAPLL
jgi:hypothetical protein